MKKGWVVLVFLFICIISFLFEPFGIKNNLHSPQIEITFRSTNYGELELYYYNGKENIFDIEHYVVKNISPHDVFQTVNFNITKEGLERIRLDFGQNEGEIEISSVVLKKSLFFERKLIGEEIIENFENINDVSRFEYDELVKVKYEDGDPHIISRPLNNIEYEFVLYKGIGKCILFFLLSALETLLCVMLIKTGIRNKAAIKSKCIELFTKEKNVKVIKGITLLIIILVFISVPVYFTVDSSWYISYLKFFEELEAFNNWNLIRGWLFPTLLYITSRLFGLTSQGMICLLLLFYLLTMRVCIYFFELYFEKKGNIGKYIITALILVNPIIFGYYHTLLTEFAGATLCMCNLVFFLYVYLKKDSATWKWNLIKILVLTFNLVCAYSLKQTYVAYVVLPYIAIEVCAFIKHKKNRFMFLSLIVSLGGMILCNKLWVNYTETGNVFKGTEVTNVSENSTGESFSKALINGATYFEIIDLNTVAILNDNMEIEETFLYNTKGKSDYQYILKCFVERPDKLIKGYIDNYFVLTNLYGRGSDHKSPVKEVSFIRGNENSSIANAFGWYSRGKKFYIDQGYDKLAIRFEYVDLEQFEFAVDSSVVIEAIYDNQVYVNLGKISFTLTLLLAPVLTVSLFVYMVINSLKKKKNDKKIEICFVIEFLVFGYVSALAILNNQIDRYCFPVYIPAILGLVIFIDIVIHSICGLCTKYRNRKQGD